MRELENILERAVALSGDDVLMADDLMLPGAEVDLPLDAEPIPADEAGAGGGSGRGGRRRRGRVSALVDGVPSSLAGVPRLARARGDSPGAGTTRYNRTAAAQLLGITFRQLRYRMQRLAIK